MRERELRELESARQLQAARQRYWEGLFRAAFEMSESELRAQLKSRSADRRFVAAYVVGERLLEWQSDLIALLTDNSDAVRLAARRALVILSFLAFNPEEARRIRAPQQPGAVRTPLEKLTPPVDFGPQPKAAKAERVEAARRWEEWWAQRLPKARSLIANDRPPAPAGETENLAAALVQADAAARQRAVSQCRDSKGAKYTEALALAIARQSGEQRQQLRQALAARMARMTDKTLCAYLEDEDAEVRRAAVLGLAMRESMGYMNNLIEMLLDPQPTVSRAAYVALCSLTGKDFGPPIQATEEDRILAAARWRKWWEEKARPGGG
jgi:HEAT repeat protein